jgi:hypothetical protein
MREFVLQNADDNEKRMNVENRLTMENCECAHGIINPECKMYTVGLHYADVCRVLHFSPQMP